MRTHKTDSKRGLHKDDRLKPGDWYQLEQLHDYLVIFHTATMATQGSQSCFHDWYPSINWLQTEIYSWQQKFETDIEADDYHSKCCTRAYEKASKYFELTDKTPIAFAAVMLNPTCKHRWFKQIWGEGKDLQKRWIDDVTQQVKELWQSEYKTDSNSASVYWRPRAVPSLLSHVRQKGTIEGVMQERLAEFKKVKLLNGVRSADALDEYLLEDNIYVEDDDKFDCLAYWYAQRQSKPELAKFALDTLAIPVMSDDPERSFSSGRDLITYRRSRLKADIIEATQCLRQSYGPPKPSKTAKGTLQEAFDQEHEVEEDYYRQNSSNGSRRANSPSAS